MATHFCLSMGYNFGCMIASDTLLDSTGGFWDHASRWRHTRFRGSTGCCHGDHFWLSIYGVHIGATWRIWLNCPCAAAMRPYVKLLWPLVTIITSAKEVMFSLLFVCLSVCLSCLFFSNFAQKLPNGFAWNFHWSSTMGQWRNGWILVSIRITDADPDSYRDTGKMYFGRGMHSPSASRY